MATRRRKHKRTGLLAAFVLEAGFLLFIVSVAQPGLVKELAGLFIDRLTPSRFELTEPAANRPAQSEPRIAVLPNSSY